MRCALSGSRGVDCFCLSRLRERRSVVVVKCCITSQWCRGSLEFIASAQRQRNRRITPPPHHHYLFPRSLTAFTLHSFSPQKTQGALQLLYVTDRFCLPVDSSSFSSGHLYKEHAISMEENASGCCLLSRVADCSCACA